MRFVIAIIGIGFLQCLKFHYKVPFLEGAAIPLFVMGYAMFFDVVEMLQNGKI